MWEEQEGGDGEKGEGEGSPDEEERRERSDGVMEVLRGWGGSSFSSVGGGSSSSSPEYFGNTPIAYLRFLSPIFLFLSL